MMKKLFLVLLLVLAMSVGASAPSDRMYNNCVSVMQKGVCAALPDPGSFTSEQLATEMSLLTKTGIVKVTMGDFLAVRGIGSVSPYDFRMCEVAKAYCDANENDNRCKVGKALWGD